MLGVGKEIEKNFQENSGLLWNIEKQIKDIKNVPKQITINEEEICEL